MIESPYADAGNKEIRDRNDKYLKAAILHCFEMGEAPFAPHGLYTKVLDDTDPDQRRLGFKAGLRWAEVADARVVYADLGITPGMEEGIKHAKSIAQPIEHRSIPGWDKS